MMQFYKLYLIDRFSQLIKRQRQENSKHMKHTFYREIYKMDDPNEYSPYELVNLIKNIVFEGEESNYIKLGLELQMQRMNRKNIYVGIKWLIFIHQVIQISTSIQIIEITNRFIQIVTSPYTSQKIEEYIKNKLFNPYRQYLKKLILKKIQKMERTASQQELKYQIYGEYNFINYAISEFSIPIRQLTPFLQTQYPYLNLYIELISKDIMPIYKRVLHSFQENLMSKLTFIEIQNMATKILIFHTTKKDQKTLQATTGNSQTPQQASSPKTLAQITPFFCLQSSNIGLNTIP